MGKRELAIAFGAGRALFGLGYVIDPARAGVGWIGNPGAERGPMVGFRSVGGRDLALGAGAALAAAEERGETAWFAAHAASDLIDVLGTLLAGEAVPERSRRVALLVAGGSAISAAALAVAYARD